MIETSDLYKDEIISGITKPRAKAIFELLDTTAAADCTNDVTAESDISKIDQLTNSVRKPTFKYASFEDDIWLLDGSFVLPPKSTETGFEIGWIGDELSQTDSTYSVPQVLECTFSVDHTSIGLSLSFDSSLNEYASDFTISVYDSIDTLIYTTSVTNNTDALYILQQNLESYRKVVVSITKWKGPNRRVRLLEVDFGIVKEYVSTKIINMNIIEEIDLISDYVSSNEISLTLDNTDGEFDILNPIGFYEALQRKQKITPYLGILKSDGKEEFIQMGEYYLWDWENNEDYKTTQLIFRDIMDDLSNNTYKTGTFKTDTLYNFAVDVFTSAGITNYSIDASLQSITVTSYIPVISYKEALQSIAIASRCLFYIARSGVPTIKPSDYTVLDYTLDYSKIAKPIIKLDELYNYVELNINGFKLISAQEIFEDSFLLSETKDVKINYTDYPAVNVSSAISGGTINSETYYASFCIINITPTNPLVAVTLTLTGDYYEEQQILHEKEDTDTKPGESSLVVNLNDNTLITTEEQAELVAIWILAAMDRRKNYDITFSGDPSIELVDTINVENDYTANRDVVITRQEFTYDGGLECIIQGKGE